jgi:hypothetical protein
LIDFIVYLCLHLFGLVLYHLPLPQWNFACWSLDSCHSPRLRLNNINGGQSLRKLILDGITLDEDCVIDYGANLLEHFLLVRIAFDLKIKLQSRLDHWVHLRISDE